MTIEERSKDRTMSALDGSVGWMEKIAAHIPHRIETMIGLNGKTTWLVYVNDHEVFADQIDGADHDAAYAAAVKYTDLHYKGVAFIHDTTKQVA